MRRAEILGVPLAAQAYEEGIGRLLELARGQRTARAHFCTVHSVVESTANPALAAAFRSADVDCMDGVPLVWVARSRGFREAERVCGPDVMISVVDRGRELGLRHYFVGGRPGTPARLVERLDELFPGVLVVGTESPPFRDLTPEEDAALVARINEARPDIVWIGLGAPKQELWAADHQAHLNARLLMPVGAAFDYHSGGLRRAPRWMHRVGLEWLFRLAMEPRRLFRRYLATNLRFVSLLVREEIARRRGRTRPR